MKGNLKRSLSLILALVLILGMLPSNALRVYAADDDTSTVATDYTVADVDAGKTATVKGDPNKKPDGNIPNGSEWTKADLFQTKSCDKEEGHIHTLEDCFTTVCLHGLNHSASCIPNATSGCGFNGLWGCKQGHSAHYSVGSTFSKTWYGGTCNHQCTADSGCCIPKCFKEENHYHSDANNCYTYNWKLQWKQYTITWNIGEGAWADDSSETAKTVTVKHTDVLKAPAVKESFKVNDPEKGEITYTFQGWEGLADGATATGNATYTAKYTTKTVYTATLNLDGGEGATELRIEKGETFAAPVNPTKTDYMFVKWVLTGTDTEYTFGTAVTGNISLTAVWALDKNGNNIPDETETIKVIIDANGNVTLTDGNGKPIEVSNVSALYDSTSGKVTIVATPASGYYVDVTVNNGAVLTGSWENKDIDSGFGTDRRNVYTGSFTVESGKSYEVTVKNTKQEFSKPVQDLNLEVNGATFDSWLDATQKGNAVAAVVLTALYGENYDSSRYTCDFGIIGSGAWGIKLNEQFSVKVVEKGDAKHPDVSANFKVTLTDNRDFAEITHTYVNNSAFNTEDDFKKGFAATVLFNGTAADFNGLTSLGKNGEISWTLEANGTYTATVKALSKEGWKETTATFSGLTWTVSEYAIEFKDWDGSVILAAKNYPYGTLVGDIEVPADPSRTGYTFTGWNPVVSAVTEKVTYVAVYEINPYTVTWIVDGVETKETYNYGTPIIIPADPAKTGYTFTGWDREIPATVPAYDVTITATWQVNMYNITWDVDGVETTIPYEYDSKVSKENPVKEGWGFVGWFDADGNKFVSPFNMPAENLELTTRFFQAAAMIGETPYETLEEALAAAQDGDTVLMLKDATASGKITVNKNITIDGNRFSIIANHSNRILETASDCTIKNVTLNTNNKAKGIKINSGNNVVFDNVTIPNSNKGNALDIEGTLLIKTYFKAVSSYSVMDAMRGTVTVAEGTVFDMTTFRGTASMNSSDDLRAAVGTDGEPFFVGYTGTSYYTQLTSLPNGLALLKDATFNGATISSATTIDLNGNTLTVADGKTLTVKATLTVNGAGTIEGNVVLAKESASITAAEDAVNPENGMDMYDVQYDSGKYFLGSKLTFIYGNGEPDGVGIVPAGYSITGVAEPVWEKHIFAGWDKEINLTPDGDATYTAQWIDDRNENGVADAEEIFSVTVNGNGGYEVPNAIALGDGKYLFDSTNPTVTIVAKPVVNDGISASYVASINGAALVYDTQYNATTNLTLKNGDEIVIIFNEAKFTYDEDGQMRFYVGMEDPDYATLYNALIKNPAYSVEAVGSNVKYLARTEGEYKLDLSAIRTLLSEIKLVGSIAVGVFDNIYPEAKTTIPLEEKWLNVGDPFEEGNVEEAVKKAIDEGIEKIKALIADGKYLEAISAIGDLVSGVSAKVGTIGCHAFGKNTLVDAKGNVQEVISVVYDDGKMHLENNDRLVTLVDDRIITNIIAEDVTVTYKDYTAEELFALIAPELVDADGNPVVGDVILSSKVKGNEAVGTFEVTVVYKGSYDYKPATKTVTVTVEKASASIDIPNVQVVYNDGYSVDPTVTLGNKYGDPTELTESMIQFLIGLDVSEFDIDGDGVKGLSGKVQLILPMDIQELLDAAIGLTGGNTSDGMEMSLSDLMKYLDLLPDSSMDSLNQILESIMHVVEAGDLTIVIGGDLPSNVGAYLYGAVSTSSNYETAFDVAYILIKPDASRVYIDWNYTDSNAVFTWNLLQSINLGASAFDDDAFSVKNDDATALINNLFFGIDENGEFAIGLHAKGTDVEDLEKTLGNGAFVQLAFIADFGNEMYYAVPIVRPVVIVPNVVDVQIAVDGNVANTNNVTFDNAPVDVQTVVDFKDLAIEEGWTVETTLHYYGLQTNGKTYDSENAPTHAGAYAVTATLIIRDENGDMIAVGADVTTVVIVPAQSSIEVADKIEIFGGEIDPMDQIKVESGAAVCPDTTVIIGTITTNGTFDENGLSALVGNVNIDFPRWVDELIAKYAPSVVNGITVADFAEKLVNKLPDITAELEELGATNEIVNSLKNAINNVASVLEDVPENVTLSFVDDLTVTKVGAYMIIGVVTDSDHIPSMDMGYLVVVPEITNVELKWNYEDKNGIFTRDLLELVDLLATAYNKDTTNKNDEATGEITYQYIGINADGEPVIYTDPENLPNGAYIQLAYIALEFEGQMVISDMIARPVVIVPSNCKVEIEELHTEFDNTSKTPDVIVKDLQGNEIDTSKGTLTFLYAGMHTNGQSYLSDKAPVHAGVYEVIVIYTENDENGEMRYYGAGVGGLVIKPTDATIDITGGNVMYDGNDHTADVVIGSAVNGMNPDFTLISGGVYISGNVNEVDVDAFHGNVNINFPKWFDAVLAEYEFADGVNAAYLRRLIDSYRDEMVGKAEETLAKINVDLDITKLNAYIDELLAVLAQMPNDVALTFNDNVSYVEPGYYFYYGIVTDSDHMPCTDTGLLVIEKMDMVFDLTDTTVTWDGNGHVTNVTNPKGADYITVIIDRLNNNINLVLDADAQFLLNSLADLLGVAFDGDVQISTIIDNYDGAEVAAAIVELIDGLQQYEISEEVAKALAVVKAELVNLPANGTVEINGQLPSEVGAYEVYAVSYAQYYKTTTSESVLEIVPVRVEIVLDDNSKVYGNADPELTYKVNYYDHLDNLLADASIANVTVSRVPGENVGIYAITAQVELTDGVRYVLIAEPEAAEFEITSADITSVEASDLVYNGFEQNTTLTVIGVNGEILREGIDFMIISGNKATDVDTYTVTIEGIGNYKGVYTAQWSIIKASVTVAVDDASKVYGENDPTFSAAVNGLLGDDALNITFTREEGENVGEYDIYASASDANYDITFVNGTLTIEKAKIAVTMDDVSKVYGEADPSFTYTITTDYTGEFMLVVPQTRIPGENTGTYEIKPEAYVLLSDNFEVEVIAGALTIEKATIVIVGGNATIIYGETTPTMPYTVTVNNCMDPNKAFAEVLTFIGYDADEVADAGEYGIAFGYNLDGLKNWSITVVGGKLTVEKRTVTVIVLPDRDICVGGQMPEFTITIEDAYNNVSATVNTDNVKLGELGAYTITADVVCDENNYNVVIEAATLTVSNHIEVKTTIETTDPTCTGNGSHRIVVTCECCDTELDRETIEIPATGHTEGETREENRVDATVDNVGGYDMVTYCQHCGAEMRREHYEMARYVAQNTVTNIYYDDVSDALAAAKPGETVILLVDGETEAMLMVNSGVTFNLNGHTITAGNIFSFGDVIDENGTADGLGGIITSNDKTKAFVQLQQANTYLPLYDATNGCYRFFYYELINKGVKVVDAAVNKVKFGIALEFTNVDAYTLLKDTANSGVEIYVTLDWSGKSDGLYAKHTITAKTIINYAEYCASGFNSGYAMTVTVSELNNLKSGDYISATATISSETGVIGSNNPIVYTIG